jgi:hypothetical protein
LVPIRPLTAKSTAVLAKNFRQNCFRANPEYELVLLDQLSPRQQELLGALRGDPHFLGLLRPRSANRLTAKAVSQETAEFFRLLQRPGPLPSSLIDGFQSEITIRRLVFDQILQVEQGAGWVGGPAACGLEALPWEDENTGTLARLSLDAIQHAASLENLDGPELSDCLYRSNTVPLTAQWLRRIPDGPALEEYLQIGRGGRCQRELEQDWVRAPGDPEQNVWMAWDSRSVPVPLASQVGYKLYLSPVPSQVKDALRILIPAITAAGAYHFKVGGDVRGLLRPDKILAYFAEKPALMEAAHRISREFSGCPAQGVPFTAELDSGALLSWASDPPSETAVPAWLRRQSWRQWTCDRLGSALAIAKGEKSGAAPAWRFALERLRWDGVDITTWEPDPALWQPNSADRAGLS